MIIWIEDKNKLLFVMKILLKIMKEKDIDIFKKWNPFSWQRCAHKIKHFLVISMINWFTISKFTKFRLRLIMHSKKH